MRMMRIPMMAQWWVCTSAFGEGRWLSADDWQLIVLANGKLWEGARHTCDVVRFIGH